MARSNSFSYIVNKPFYLPFLKVKLAGTFRCPQHRTSHLFQHSLLQGSLPVFRESSFRNKILILFRAGIFGQ